MSELMTASHARADFRRRLLTTASTIALLTACVGTMAEADDDSRPIVWIELGVHTERVDGGLEPFAPPFVSHVDTSILPSPAAPERPPGYAIGGDAKISFQPEDTDWVFSASARYGRSNSTRSAHGETHPVSRSAIYSLFGQRNSGFVKPVAKNSVEATARNTQNQSVIDFQAGKDVGLGAISSSESLLSLGIRFAQFTSKTLASINAVPDFHFHTKYFTVLPPPFPPLHGYVKFPAQMWHVYQADAELQHSFRGIGPSLTWNASAPMFGLPGAEQIVLDWGLNGAMLFGRQKTQGHHRTNAVYGTGKHYTGFLPVVYNHSYNVTRSRSVIVPNVGGFAGLSLKFPNAKLSIGYRGDFFFRAMDGGVDTAKKETRGFYGPFATISVGIGG